MKDSKILFKREWQMLLYRWLLFCWIFSSSDSISLPIAIIPFHSKNEKSRNEFLLFTKWRRQHRVSDSLHMVKKYMKIILLKIILSGETGRSDYVIVIFQHFTYSFIYWLDKLADTSAAFVTDSDTLVTDSTNCPSYDLENEQTQLKNHVIS